jgi:hypothetical protein
MEEDDWSDLDEEQGPATAMEANQQASQSAAASSPKHTPPTQTMEDMEMEIDTRAAIELRPNKEGFLRMEVENPPECYSTAYPVNLETFKTHFLNWYRHRENKKDNMPTSKNKQIQAIYYATVCLVLDFEKFFHDRMNLSYFDVLYELTFGMCINIDWRTNEERFEKKPVIFIPFVQSPQFYQDELQQKTRTAWYWSDENLSYIPRESLLAFFYFDARVQQKRPIDIMNEYEANDVKFFRDRVVALWTLQHFGSLKDTNLPTLPLRMEGDEG